MKQAIRIFDEQYLVQTTAELRDLRGEIERLKELVREAEAFRRSRTVQPAPIIVPDRVSPTSAYPIAG